MRSLTIAGAVLGGLLLAPLASPAQAADEHELTARMGATAAYPQARGHADYESGEGHREFEVTLRGLASLAGRRITVRVHGDLVGRTVVRPSGWAHLERHRGVPGMAAGDVVRVRRGDGVLVSAGRLHREHD
ncbi:MAG TPA: hypothetical protein VFL69_08285 [Marmoricola sp.]|nr:hypothetical protein [Marmoricola sp.]